ncbi:MAG: Ig-like domain-containing protein, partial [Bacteroidaceae bacterium]|nr:Ig-like domain-containing protein [Bacteroidaceae bacterium]
MRKLWDTLSGEDDLTRSRLNPSFRTTTLYFLIFILSFFLLAGACASLGSPDGGPYDETPPQVVSASPVNQATNSDKKKINILFNEYIKIENASEKVVV